MSQESQALVPQAGPQATSAVSRPWVSVAQAPGSGFGGAAPEAPGARYILPQFEERTSYGTKIRDPYSKLFEDRIVFLGVQIDDTSADDIMAQLLVLESQDPERDITIYINSPGGSQTALTAIYDTMQYIKPHIQTVCLGQAASAAAVLLAAGSHGKRLALPNAQGHDSPAPDRRGFACTGLGYRDLRRGNSSYARVVGNHSCSPHGSNGRKGT